MTAERIEPIELKVFTKDDQPYQFTYFSWTVRWWEWAFSEPIETNPVLDLTGEHAGRNQGGPVWFLAGTIGDQNIIANRRCNVPCGKAILFPVINYVYTHGPEFNSDLELIRHVTKDIDDITVIKATIDGMAAPVCRISSKNIFRLKVKQKNRLDIPIGAHSAAADGYWVFLKPLPKGKHEIFFHGACSGGTRNATANYNITVP